MFGGARPEPHPNLRVHGAKALFVQHGDYERRVRVTGASNTGFCSQDGGGDASEIRDLADVVWASIDNDDSRDLDQLTVADTLAGDTVRIRVAVADVDALVKAGSAIDTHARHNTTSVYTAAEVFPMLPRW